MTSGQDIGIVVQGNIRSNTADMLLKLRRQMPQAQLVLSTFLEDWAQYGSDSLLRCLDQLQLSPDPGPMPSTVRSSSARPNNVNRMLVSTTAGLAALRTSLALKLRSDAELDVRFLYAQWRACRDNDGVTTRLAFASRYTRHPDGLNGYLFHLSDWLCFGELGSVRDYWNAPAWSMTDALWFRQAPHSPGTTATTVRYQARMTPEQWLCTRYAARLGYSVPTFLNERSPNLMTSYRRFLAQQCLILDPEPLGLRVPGHERANLSWFQQLDCVSHQDWRVIAGLNRESLVMPIARGLARTMRHPIARAVLLRKWVGQQLVQRSAV